MVRQVAKSGMRHCNALSDEGSLTGKQYGRTTIGHFIEHSIDGTSNSLLLHACEEGGNRLRLLCGDFFTVTAQHPSDSIVCGFSRCRAAVCGFVVVYVFCNVACQQVDIAGCCKEFSGQRAVGLTERYRVGDCTQRGSADS